MPTPPTELDQILTKAFNDYYDYITQEDIVKAAHEYSKKTVYKEAKAAIQALINQARVEEIKTIDGIVMISQQIEGKDATIKLSTLREVLSNRLAELSNQSSKGDTDG